MGGNININAVNAYDSYKQSYQNAVRQAGETAADKTDRKYSGWDTDSATYEKTQDVTETAETSTSGTVKLSEKAQKLLEELKEKYSDTDFIIADYSTDEEADELLSRGTSEYSVLIDPETLEKMAADDTVKQQYLDQIDSARDQFDQIKNDIDGIDDISAKSVNITFDENGKAQIALKLIQNSTEKEVSVKTSAIDDLLEKIQSIDWDNIPAKSDTEEGSKIDYTV